MKDQLTEVEVELPKYTTLQVYPYYGLLEGINEDDPNYLLKLLRIKPERGYVPTFLAGKIK